MSRIVQHTPVLSIFDAVSNDVVEIKKLLDSVGIENAIIAEVIDEKRRDIAYSSMKFNFRKDDIILLHFSTFSEFYYSLSSFKQKKIIRYHNITPPKFFINYDAFAYENCKNGIDQLKKYIQLFNYAIAHSSYNAEELKSYGYKGEVEVIPIIYTFSKYKENFTLKKKLSKTTNILFVGRFAPNKRQIEVVKAFALYNKFYNQKSKLFLVGGYESGNEFFKEVDYYVKKLDLEKKVIITGKVSDEELFTYYKNSSVFLSMSAHEGFSVPMLECMQNELPVLAYYNSGALPDTIGGGAVFFRKLDYFTIAGLVNELVVDKNIRQSLIKAQKEQIKKFEYDSVKTKFLSYLNKHKII